VYQTTFIESANRHQGIYLDATSWIWYLSLALIISASINVFNFGRYFESRQEKKR
jgi:hypothetical protein